MIFIKSMERPNFPFVPNQILYTKTGIRRKRFGMILRDEVSPTIAEINAIAKYFEVPVSQLIEEK